jgi:hypothetical protein
MGTALVLAWVAIVLLTLSVAGLMRQVHLLLTERAAEREPASNGSGPRSLPVTLLTAGGGRASATEHVVLFASTTCVACAEVMPVLVEHCGDGERSCTVVTAAQRHPDWPDALTYRENAADLFEHFGVVATPHALRIVDGVVVESAPVGSIAALRRVIGGSRSVAVTEPAAPVGASAKPAAPSAPDTRS